MKIKAVRLSEKDKRKAYKSAVRKVNKELGIDLFTRRKIHRNKKKYSRKAKFKGEAE